MSPLISVILPVYNQEKYVAETIESVLSQTFADFELLLHDDGSTDGSAAIIHAYAARDPRIRASFAPNAGRCEATNRLVALARGQWCALLDADDVMLPERLEKQLAFHRLHPEVDATSCHCYYINEHGQHLGVQRHPGPSLLKAEDGHQALESNQYVICAFTGLMISPGVYEQAGGLRSQFWPGDDFEFFNRLLERKFTLVVIQQVLMRYRVHTASVSMRKPSHMLDVADYITCCLQLRRAGHSEISFVEFMAERQHDSWWIKANRWADSYAMILHRQAGFCLYTKNYVRFAWTMTTVLLLSPRFTLATIRNRMVSRPHSSSSALRLH
jgi:glycosyltransferase involved in cell wall biosynthesis